MSPHQQPTHFLSLPLPSTPSSLHKTLRALSAALPPHLSRAVRPATTLHLTLCVLDLRDPLRLASAVEILRDLDLGALWRGAVDREEVVAASASTSTSTSLQTQTLTRTQTRNQTGTKTTTHAQTRTETKTSINIDAPKSQPRPQSIKGPRITLRGLASTSNPEHTSVLYAPPDDPTHALQRFCESIRARFASLIGPPIPLSDGGGTNAAGSSTTNNTNNNNGRDAGVVGEITGRIRSLELDGVVAATTTAMATGTPTPPQSNTSTSKKNKPLPSLLLHATVLNTVYLPKDRPSTSWSGNTINNTTTANSESNNSNNRGGGRGRGGARGSGGRGGHGRRNAQRVKLDARQLMEQFADALWMEDVRIDKLTLCRMGARRVGGVERYIVEEGVEMP